MEVSQERTFPTPGNVRSRTEHVRRWSEGSFSLGKLIWFRATSRDHVQQLTDDDDFCMKVLENKFGSYKQCRLRDFCCCVLVFLYLT